MTSDLLAVVDMQEGFRCPEIEDIIPAIKKLVQSFKGEIIFSCFRNPKGSLFEDQLQWQDFQEKKDVKILEELRDFDAGCVFHTGYTVFNEEMKKLVREKDIERIYLSGIYTDVCIAKAAMDIFDNGIDVYVVSDACASPHGSENHRVALDTLKHVLGEENVVSMERVLNKE